MPGSRRRPPGIDSPAQHRSKPRPCSLVWPGRPSQPHTMAPCRTLSSVRTTGWSSLSPPTAAGCPQVAGPMTRARAGGTALPNEGAERRCRTALPNGVAERGCRTALPNEVAERRCRTRLPNDGSCVVTRHEGARSDPGAGPAHRTDLASAAAQRPRHGVRTRPARRPQTRLPAEAPTAHMLSTSLAHTSRTPATLGEHLVSPTGTRPPKPGPTPNRPTRRGRCARGTGFCGLLA